MTLGEKIKKLRKERGLTQAALCGDFMTRNMLSQIESDSAVPSVATLRYLAEQLDIPSGYFIDDTADLLSYRKLGIMPQMRKLFAEKNYQKCLDLCKTLSDFDDELTLIMASCYLNIGMQHYKNGFIEGARRALSLAEVFATRTEYPHEEISRTAAVYLAMMNSIPGDISLPSIVNLTGESFNEIHELLLYLNLLRISEAYKYEVAAQVYDVTALKNPLYRTHVNARLSVSSGNYARALMLLRELIDRFDEEAAPYAFRYLIYADTEEVCKTMGDYKGAYEASRQRLECEEKFTRHTGMRSDPHL